MSKFTDVGKAFIRKYTNLFVAEEIVEDNNPFFIDSKGEYRCKFDEIVFTIGKGIDFKYKGNIILTNDATATVISVGSSIVIKGIEGSQALELV